MAAVGLLTYTYINYSHKVCAAKRLSTLPVLHKLCCGVKIRANFESRKIHVCVPA